MYSKTQISIQKHCIAICTQNPSVRMTMSTGLVYAIHRTMPKQLHNPTIFYNLHLCYFIWSECVLPLPFQSLMCSLVSTFTVCVCVCSDCLSAHHSLISLLTRVCVLSPEMHRVAGRGVLPTVYYRTHTQPVKHSSGMTKSVRRERHYLKVKIFTSMFTRLM
jgi:hypothetical protein